MNLPLYLENRHDRFQKSGTDTIRFENRTNLVRGFWNKEMKIQNKGAVLVQIAPLFISQPRNQNQSITKKHIFNGTVYFWESGASI